MSVSIADFWRLAAESYLIDANQCHQLSQNFAQVKGAGTQGNSKTLSEWLIAQKVLTRYQATILLGGRSGPFFYGDYKLTDRIQGGRWDGCFRADHVQTGHPVILQFLAGPASQDPNQWAVVSGHALRECAVVHPNIHRCYEPVDLVSFKFVTLEDCAGKSLQEQVEQSGPLPASEVTRITRLIALGLSRLHQNGQPHGDIRPANLWLEPNGNAKIIRDPFQPPAAVNFGHPDPSGLSLARADYAAPELGQPGKAPDFLTDIYALGCSMYFLLTGRPPFAGGDAPQKLGRHATEPIQPLEPLGVPQPVSQMVTYMMAKNPTVRYQQINMIVEQLNAIVPPGQMQLHPQPTPPTMAGFEQFIGQKNAAMSGQAPAQPVAAQPAAPAINIDTSSPTEPAKSETNNEAAAAVATAQPKFNFEDQPAGDAADEGITTDASTGETKPVPTPEEYAQRREKEKTKKIAIGLASVAGLIIVTLLATHFMSDPDKPTGPEVTSNNEEDLDPNGQPNGDPTLNENNGNGTNGNGTNGNGNGTNGNGATNVSINGNPNGVNGNPNGINGINGNGNGNGNGTNGNGTNGNGTNGNGNPAPPTTQVIDDTTGQLLWASPTSGEPMDFRMVPPGASVYIHARPADLLASEQGNLALKSLGPMFDSQRASWEAAAGVTLDKVATIIMSVHDNGDEFPFTSYVVRLAQPMAKSDLLAKLKNPQVKQFNGSDYYTGNGYAYYIPSQANITSYLMGNERDVKDVAVVGPATPALSRAVNNLRKVSDSSRHLTVIANPRYLSSSLFRDGRSWYFGEPAKIRGPLEWFVGDDVTSVMLSAQFDDEFYYEMRVEGVADVQKQDRAAQMKARIAEIPSSISKYIVTLSQNQYWEAIRIQYPNMIRAAHKYTRVGVEDNMAMINGTLPGYAGHNLLFGSELVLSSGAGSSVIPTEPTAPKITTLAEALQIKMSISFGQDSLEFSMANVVREVEESAPGLPIKFRIKIIGEDLKLDGITRNQQIRDFNESDKSVADVLTALVHKANPTRTSQVSEPAQKLLWVIGPDPEDGKESILITTRQIASQNDKYKIPPVFGAK
jgi:serine/threonine protein kinase